MLQLEYIWIVFYFFLWFIESPNTNTSCAGSYFFNLKILIRYIIVLWWLFIWIGIYLHSHALGLKKSTFKRFLIFYKLSIILFLLLIVWSTTIALFILLPDLFLHIGKLIEMLFNLFRNASWIFWKFYFNMLVGWWFFQRLLYFFLWLRG